jgi:Zn-dependent protease
MWRNLENSMFNKTVISFAISLALWSLLFGSVEIALGFLALLFVHEMGHFFAAKQKNLAVDPPVFTPIGAFIAMKELPASARDEAYMAFGGPLLGTIGAIVALVLGMVLGVPVLVQVSMYAFWLNLFNLIPLAPLDGGRISMAIDRRMWVIGAAVFAYFMFSFGMNGFNLLIGLFIGMQAYQDIQMRKNMAAVQPSYFDVGFNTRLGYAIAYLALGGFLLQVVTHPQWLPSLLASLGL